MPSRLLQHLRSKSTASPTGHQEHMWKEELKEPSPSSSSSSSSSASTNVPSSSSCFSENPNITTANRNTNSDSNHQLVPSCTLTSLGPNNNNNMSNNNNDCNNTSTTTTHNDNNTNTTNSNNNLEEFSRISKRVSFFTSLHSMNESGLFESLNDEDELVAMGSDGSSSGHKPATAPNGGMVNRSTTESVVPSASSSTSQEQQETTPDNPSNQSSSNDNVNKKPPSLTNIEVPTTEKTSAKLLDSSPSNSKSNITNSNAYRPSHVRGWSSTVSPLSPSDFAIKTMPARNRGNSSSFNNLISMHYSPLLSSNKMQTNTTSPMAYSANTSNAITISNNGKGTHDGGSSGSSGSGSGGTPLQFVTGSVGSGGNPLLASFSSSSYALSNNFGLGGKLTRGMSVTNFQPPALKRAQSVLHHNKPPVANSFGRHNIDPKWDMRKDDCFGEDLIDLLEDESSPAITKKSTPLAKQASVFAAASASFAINNNGDRASPRLLFSNSRDRAMSVDHTTAMFDRVGNVLKERAKVVQLKMNRDLKTFLWEMKDMEVMSSDLEQIEKIAKDILDCKSIDDLCNRDFMKELQTLLQTCVSNYATLTHQSCSPSMHVLSATPTMSSLILGSVLNNIDPKAVTENFEVLKQAKKLIFIYSRINRVLELYKKHLIEEANREQIKRQRVKSVIENVEPKDDSYDSSGSQDSTNKRPNSSLLKPIDEEDTSSTSVSPRRSSVSSNSKFEIIGESSDIDSPISSPRSSLSNNGTPTTGSKEPVTPSSEKKKASEGFFSKFFAKFAKRDDSPTLTPTIITDKKSRSANNTPTTDPKKKDKQEKDSNVIEILCRICEELVPSTQLAEHSATCAVKHKVEMQSITVFEKLKNVRKALEKTVKKKKTTSLYKLLKIAKKAENSKDRTQLQEIIGTLNQIIEEHKDENFVGNNYRVTVYAKRLLDVIEAKCTALLHEEKQSSATKKKIKISDFEIIKPISRGAYGRVYLAQKKTTNDIYAIKVIKKQYLYNHKNVGKTLTNEPDLLAERTIMKVLMENNEQSPFIVNFYYSFAGKRYLYIVMEYCPGGSLDCLLADKLENGEAFDIDTVRHIAAETILALYDLHHNKIVHRDLKPDNMLIDRNGHLKLTDFGLSEIGLLDREDEQTSASKQSLDSLRQDDDESEIQVRGTPDYLAPELLLGMQHNEAVDFWSLGCILFELLFGCPPFNDETPEYIFDNILSRNINWVDERLLPPEIVSSGVIDFIDKLLDPNPETRLNDKTAREHPFMQGVDWDKVLKEPLGVLPNVTNLLDTSKFKPREENYPMHFKGDSMDAKSLSDIDDSSESLTEHTEMNMAGSVFTDMQTPPQGMKQVAASHISSSFHSGTYGSYISPGTSITPSSLGMASPSLVGSVIDSFSFPEHINTAALSRLNEEMLRRQQQGQQQQIDSNAVPRNDLTAASSSSSSGHSNISAY
ncbi:hypothetical protein FDP41_000095 [Naegleria fowleri]|uniref:non-specific serine/threonine protein kinase n=1 Tax=Naegleria fowleri TaxID=5763 RepID=A0A6A5CBH7_NAEFO|nr:uncharacterized protein FDP41_000095 [Naegleria fowleri]KAF0985056.1 hypothetical protein FDP41_000095 [Naegleria fowleri]